MEKLNIGFNTSSDPETLEPTADKEFIEQVLINLFTNAIDAVKDIHEKKIDLISRLDDSGRVLIVVSDNGTCIDSEILDKAFTPFFTIIKRRPVSVSAFHAKL
ncbi:MAG: ATP-binding protein [candidate division Zixibacteria bacterium]